MGIIEGALPRAGYVTNAGVPGAGTDEVWTLTIGGTPSGGTFKISFDGYTTAPITWSSTNATLIANIDAALEALPSIGTGGVVTAAGSLTAGVGTITITGAGNLGKKALGAFAIADNSLTGTSPTVGITETTPGVDAFGRGMPKGATVYDTTNNDLYVNIGTALAPSWQVVGAQS